MKYFIIDYLIVLTYLVLCLIVGIYRKGKIENIKDYGIGNRNLSSLVLFATIVATDIGAGSSIGIVQSIYKYGIPYAVAQVFVVFSWYTASIIFPRGVYKFHKCICLPDIVECLYGKYAKYIAAILSILMAISIVAAQISGLGLVFEQLLGIDYYTGVAVGLGVILTYSTIGGIKAVTWTDFFQFFILVVAIPISYTVIFNEIGGVSPLLYDRSLQNVIDFFSKPSFFVGIILYRSLPGVNAPFMQRVLMASGYNQLKTVLKNVAKFSIVYSILLGVLGLSLRALYPNGKGGFFLYINQFIPIGMKGIIISGLLAIIMSSADSWLNSTSVVVYRSLIKDLFISISTKYEVLIARIATIMICLFGFVASLHHFEIMDLLFVAVNLWNPIVLIPTLAGFLNLKISKANFYSASFAGVLGVIGYYFVEGHLNGLSLFIGVLCNALVIFVCLVKNWLSENYQSRRFQIFKR